ncbi:unnamed protein product [Hymenolepis diminuta]|uniref:Enkurin domain-containing protein n=2 Tax=Hymenolepis diminuta TaxID=6216 RepID=A0A158QFF0_HYMDI|nr:unnamed protein product [Hymenolepis diminuta]
MDLVHSSLISATVVLYLRILIHYGTQLFPLNEKHLDRFFTRLLATLDAFIFIHNDCLISKEKPSLRGSQSKRLFKQHSDSFKDPVTFEGQFNLDFDSTDAGPRAEVRSLQQLPKGLHELNVDIFFPVTPGALDGDLFAGLQHAVRRYLMDYQRALKSILKDNNAMPRSLTAYYFQHEDQLIRVFYPPSCKDELELRKKMHAMLKLPQYPILRRGLALFPTRSFRRLLGPNQENLVCPHLLLPPIPSNTDVTVEIIRGRYTYKHYLQDGIDDKNWGCAYRSLQTLVSWLLWQGIVSPLQPLPSHRSIQEALVKVGDKPSKFIGSRQWIGSLEVSFCISELYGVQCRLIPVARGRDFTSTAAAVLVEHFSAGGGPVMVGGGELAHTIIGVAISGSGKTRYLILDPHYTGTPGDSCAILAKSWVGWKEEGFWKPEVPYNLCLLPPPDDPYQSIYHPLAIHECEKRKSGRFKTIGPAETPKPEPKKFLRSHVALNVHKVADPVESENICPGKKPLLPDFRKTKFDERPTRCNIVSQNKLSALLSEPKKPQPFIVDTRNGHKYSLIGSGLTKFYVYKDDFGKVPNYIHQRKKKKIESDQLYEQYLQEMAMHQQKPRLSDEERRQLLARLKERHAKLYKDFLCLSVIIDTLHQKQRKAYLEKELNDIEKDIRTVEGNQFIFVEEK